VTGFLQIDGNKKIKSLICTMMCRYSVAVIIPCFDSSKFIRKTIESALNQDYDDLEIIAINDGSTDETREILESYLPKIRILSHPKNANLGTATSKNLGINETKSGLIAFLDSDDIWHPNKIKEQVKIFQKYLDIGLVYTNGYVIDEIDNLLYKLFPDDFQEENIPRKILLRCYIRTPSSVMVKREIFEKTGLFKTYLLNSQDHEMWIRMSEIAKFYYIPDFFISYRKRPDQISLRRQLWEEGFIILRESCKRYPYGLNLKRKRLAVLYYRLGEYDWEHHDYLRGAKNYFLEGMLDPFRAIDFTQNKTRVKTFL
jgi:glycosyltransferase involved in cell wall biosynthesis